MTKKTKDITDVYKMMNKGVTTMTHLEENKRKGTQNE
jgi:hypothetical protein